MSLLAPEVTGPLSPCSQTVRIRGHIAGATVTVHVNGTETSSAVSNWPDDIFDLGTTLAAGDKVTARQELDGEQSPESPLPVVVQQLPASLSNLVVVTHLHECGTAVRAEGAMPGAEVKALVNGTEVGATTSVHGVARLNYTPGLGVDQTLSLEQSTCSGLTKTTPSPPADQVPKPLPAPRIEEPLIECMTAVTLSDVVDGATVNLYRDGTKTGSFAYDVPSGTWWGHEPFKKGEHVEVEQAFYCRKSGEPTHVSSRASIVVQGLDALEAPKILTPICPDATLITVTDLVPGARVILYQDGHPVGTADTPEATFTFNAPPLDPGAPLTARMRLCDQDGPLSDPVAIEGGEALSGLVVSKLYDCASSIALFDEKLWTGKVVYAKSKALGGISAHHQVFEPAYVLPVSPSLVAGDEINIVVRGCGGSEDTFGPYEVAKTPGLPPPVVRKPTIEGTTAVTIESDFAGALIRLYVDGTFTSQTVSLGDEISTRVPVPDPLQVGQQLTATQELCGKTSKMSDPVTVVIPPPEVPELVKPSDGEDDVARQNTVFAWNDPGAGTSAAATSFEVEVTKANNSPVALESAGSSTSHTLSADLDYETGYFWRVNATNSTGTTSCNWNSFTTEHEPVPHLVFNSVFILKDSNGDTIGSVPANQPFQLGIKVKNAGDGTADPFEVVFRLSKGVGQPTIGTSTVSFGSAPPGWADTAWTDVSPLEAGTYLFRAEIPPGIADLQWQTQAS